MRAKEIKVGDELVYMKTKSTGNSFYRRWGLELKATVLATGVEIQYSAWDPDQFTNVIKTTDTGIRVKLEHAMLDQGAVVVIPNKPSIEKVVRPYTLRGRWQSYVTRLIEDLKQENERRHVEAEKSKARHDHLDAVSKALSECTTGARVQGYGEKTFDLVLQVEYEKTPSAKQIKDAVKILGLERQREDTCKKKAKVTA